MPLKQILVEYETFNFKVWVVIGPHRLLPAFVKRKQRRVYKAKQAVDCAGLYFHERDCHRGGIIWLRDVPSTPKAIGYLAHELGHAVMDMHSRRSINMDNMNDETFCYAVAHGLTKVLEECRWPSKIVPPTTR